MTDQGAPGIGPEHGNEQLRSQGLRGGAFLAVRESLGIVLRFGGVVVVSRLIGPDNYGLYAGALAVVVVLTTVAQMGAEVYLVRLPAEPSRELYDQVFSFLILTAAGVTLISLLASVVVDALLPTSRFLGPFQILVLSIPVNVLWAPAQAKIERNLQYRRMAALELVGDVALHGTATLLALGDAGVWAPVTGVMVWQGWLLVGSYYLADLRPQWRWSTPTAKDLARFGFTLSVSGWIIRAYDLVNPLVVGRYLGASAVGHVALANRLVETLGFINRVTFRVSMVIFGRVSHNWHRLRAALEEGMALQVLAGGAALSSFALVADQALPVLFGERWLPSTSIFPFLALGALTAAGFTLQANLLVVRKKNVAVVRATAARWLILFGMAIILVPAWGLVGYGFAYVGSTIGLALLHFSLRKMGGLSYRRPLPWLIAFSPMLFTPLVGWPRASVLLLPAVFILLLPAQRSELRAYWTFIRASLLPSKQRN